MPGRTSPAAGCVVTALRRAVTQYRSNAVLFLLVNTKPALNCAFLNLKPGTGKTTTCTWLAATLHAMDLSVLHVDADKGASALSWADLAGGFPWSLMGMPQATINRQIVTVTEHGQWDAVLADLPQMEDHERIVAPALEYFDTWVIPLAPAGIELDRMTNVWERLDAIDRRRDTPGRRVVLLNRTNRQQRSKGGPDAAYAEHLTEQGYTVLAHQVPHSDAKYRQTFGRLPKLDEQSPFWGIANELIGLAA